MGQWSHRSEKISIKIQGNDESVLLFSRENRCMSFLEELPRLHAVMVTQKFEMGELFGFETRNKYAIRTESGEELGFAAEMAGGFPGFLFRQILGHMRKFEIRITDREGHPVIVARHPFRIFFQRLEVETGSGESLGAIQQRFGLLTKKFDFQDPRGQVLYTVRSGLFRIWSFPIKRGDRDVALISKKWSGALSEVFTDRDNFRVEFSDPSLGEKDRALILASALYVDLVYFETKN